MRRAYLLFVATGLLLFAASPRAEDDEIDLYDGSRKAVAYLAIDSGEVIIYLWSGRPVARWDRGDIYGFNGKHLGWFRGTVVFDHQGRIVAATEDSFVSPVHLAPMKPTKRLAPLPSLPELPPLEPMHTRDWSDVPALVFFLMGAK